jgi:hypothetical protein
MRLLLFFARVAFIFNLFFIACLIFRYNDVVTDQTLKGFVIVVGWLLAPILNFIFVLVFLIWKLAGKASTAPIPSWLVSFNIIMLIAQLFIILFV